MPWILVFGITYLLNAIVHQYTFFLKDYAIYFKEYKPKVDYIKERVRFLPSWFSVKMGPWKMSGLSPTMVIFHWSMIVSKEEVSRQHLSPENWCLEYHFPFGARPIFKCELFVSGRVTLSGIQKSYSTQRDFLGIRDYLRCAKVCSNTNLAKRHGTKNKQNRQNSSFTLAAGPKTCGCAFLGRKWGSQKFATPIHQWKFTLELIEHHFSRVPVGQNTWKGDIFF